MYLRTARTTFALLVVISHVALVTYCAIFFQDRITKFPTFVSTLSAFLPVFGIYVGVVVKEVSLKKGSRGHKVNTAFILIMAILFLAYALGVFLVIRSYETGFIETEDMLPGAIALVEAAFGGFFTTMFLTLFGVSGNGEPE